VPTNSRSDAPGVSRGAVVAGGVAFAVLATLNAGGYRYGASDQAFYIPAILRHLDPALFPRDWAMLGAQGRYFLVDEVLAALVKVTGWPLPVWFALAQVATLAALYAGAWRLGRAVLTSPWALTAWIAALTLRHRIAKTGANTLEGYFHPRMLVFGLGLLALADVLQGRRWRPVIVLAAALAVHPTTAALFLAIVVVAIVVAEPRLHRPAAVIGVGGGVAGTLGLGLGLGPDLTPMDATWRALVATKDYTFPTSWSAATWLVNLAAPIVLAATAWVRAREGRLSAHERGLVAGAAVLLAGFLATLPLVGAGVPLAVQLQTSRVFWPIETVAILFLVWWLVDRAARDGRRQTARAVAAVLVATSVLRGAYVGFVESPERATFALSLPDDAWTRALAWVRASTPRDTFVIADPGHAWKPGMGTAVRIAAARDVYLEETKDVAMAMYSRQAAHQVAARIEAAQGFDTMPPETLRRLAPAGAPAVLVTTRALDLPLRHRDGGVAVYALSP
jgi:hypothetical protein